MASLGQSVGHEIFGACAVNSITFSEELAVYRDNIMKVLLVNAAFWAAAIAFPYLVRLLPTGSGEPAKFFEFLVPVVQAILGCGATYLIYLSVQKKSSN
jgi:hypothetical protein